MANECPVASAQDHNARHNTQRSTFNLVRESRKEKYTRTHNTQGGALAHTWCRRPSQKL